MGGQSHPKVTPKGGAESLGALMGCDFGQKGKEEGKERREG